MGDEIQVGDTAAVVTIHHRTGRHQPAACGAPPGSPWAYVWRYVHCPGCEAKAPAGAIPPAARPPAG